MDSRGVELSVVQIELHILKTFHRVRYSTVLQLQTVRSLDHFLLQ